MILHLDLLRHGETELGGGLRGSLDDALTDKGWAQMRQAVAGQGPCNRYSGERVGLAPAFAVDALGATKMACPELALEADYLAALSAVTQVEESESRLVLAGPGVELVFLRP